MAKAKRFEGNVVSFATLFDGVAAERFNFALAEVMRNIYSPNHDWKKRRELVCRLTIQPTSEKREQVAVILEIITKFAALEPVGRVMAVASDGMEIVLVDSTNPDQMTLQGLVDPGGTRKIDAGE
jgi:hypothetical protein